MGDLLQNGARYLEGQRAKHLAHEVTYHRGGRAVTVMATAMEPNLEVLTEEDLAIVHRTRDFCFAAAELVIRGEQTTPESTDFITERIDDVETRYDLFSPSQVPFWGYDDVNNLRIRVHTRRA